MCLNGCVATIGCADTTVCECSCVYKIPIIVQSCSGVNHWAHTEGSQSGGVSGEMRSEVLGWIRRARFWDPCLHSHSSALQAMEPFPGLFLRSFLALPWGRCGLFSTPDFPHSAWGSK